MNERGIEVKVGILITVCAALLVFFIMALGDFGGSAGGEIFLDVDTSAALKTGAPVKIAGVPSGRVVAVDYRGGEVDEAVGRPVFVRVTLHIDEARLATLRPDARFYITTQGVLGEKYVEIEPMSAEGAPLPPGAIVEGEPPLRLEIMAMNANRVLSSLAEVLRKNEQNISDIIGNANETMIVVRRAVQRADDLLADNQPKVAEALDGLLGIEREVKQLAVSANHVIGDGSALRGAIANVSALSSDVRRAVAPVVRDIRDTLGKYGDLADVGREFVGEARSVAASSLADVSGILGDVKTMTGKMRSGEGTIGAFISDREMYDDVREMMKDLKRHPWKLIWKE